MAPKKPKKKLSDYNKFMKKELKGNTGTKTQRVARFKAAVRKWNAKRKAPRTRASPRTRAQPRAPARRAPARKPGGKTTMGNRSFSSQTVYKFIRIGALLAPAASVAISNDSPQNKLVRGVKMYMGFDMNTGRFSWDWLKIGYMPVLAASVVTYGIPKIIGLIRSFKLW